MQYRGFYTLEQAADTLDLTPAASGRCYVLRHGGVDEGDRRGANRLKEGARRFWMAEASG